MFTGIIQEVGRLKESDQGSMSVEAAACLEGLREGDSIAVNGTCLTVKALGEGASPWTPCRRPSDALTWDP